MVGNEMMADALAVRISYGADVFIGRTLVRSNGLTSESSSEKCLPDTFAGESVTRHDGVSREENPTCARRRGIDSCGDRPRSMSIFENCTFTE
jgi:hypothetical protein